MPSPRTPHAARVNPPHPTPQVHSTPHAHRGERYVYGQSDAERFEVVVGVLTVEREVLLPTCMRDNDWIMSDND